MAIGDNKLGIKKTPNGEVLNLCHGGIEEGIELMNVHTKFELVNTKWDELKINLTRIVLLDDGSYRCWGDSYGFMPYAPAMLQFFFFLHKHTNFFFVGKKNKTLHIPAEDMR